MLRRGETPNLPAMFLQIVSDLSTLKLTNVIETNFAVDLYELIEQNREPEIAI